VLQESSSNKEKWPKKDVLPPLPNAVVQLQRYLEKINEKGRATRGELLALAGSGEGLDSWIRDLKDILGLVDDSIEKGHTVYRKTLRGRRWERNLICEWDYTKAISTRYAGDRRQPLFLSRLFDKPSEPSVRNSGRKDEYSDLGSSSRKINAPDRRCLHNEVFRQLDRVGFNIEASVIL